MSRDFKYHTKDMYGHQNVNEVNSEMDDDYDDYDIDSELIDEYRQCEWTCNCESHFNTEEGVIDDTGKILSCPACGEEIAREDESDI